jgi:hypothetical protein
MSAQRVAGAGQTAYIEYTRCQQAGCDRWAETWCPLCRAYLCKTHDELYPRRRHDCLRGKAEEA